MKNPVVETSFFVAGRAKNVRVSDEKIKAFVSDLAADKKLLKNKWDEVNHLVSKNIGALLTYFFVLDTLQSCFWSKDNKNRWFVTVNGVKKTGYFALSNALKVFFENHPEKANFHYFSSISFSEFKNILQGGRNLMFLKQRWQNLKAVSRILVKKYKGNPEIFLKYCNGKCETFVKKVVRELPSFRDEPFYAGKKIFFWKRAQILAGDIFGALKNIHKQSFNDVDWLSAFADYKVPQILNSLGILEYSSPLAAKIKKNILLKQGNTEEVEIRTASVVAVRLISKELLKIKIKKHDFEIDWLLWNMSKRISMKNRHHLTKTLFY